MGERIKLQSRQMVASSMRSKCVFSEVMTYLFPDDSVANFTVKVAESLQVAVHFMLIKPICCFNGYAGHRRWAMNVLAVVIKSHGLEATSPFFPFCKTTNSHQ